MYKNGYDNDYDIGFFGEEDRETPQDSGYKVDLTKEATQDKGDKVNLSKADPEAEMNAMLYKYRVDHGLQAHETVGKPNTMMDSMINNYRLEQREKYRAFDNAVKMMNATKADRTHHQIEQFGRIFPIPDRIAEGIDDPEVFRQMYPDARPATMSDGIGKFLILFVVGLYLIIWSLNVCVHQVEIADSTRKMISEYTQVTGEVTYVYENNSRYSGTTYSVSYKYTVERKEIEGRAVLFPSTAHDLGLTSAESRGEKITVYIDPKDVKKSLIAAVPYPKFYQWLTAPTGALLIIFGLNFLLDCRNGKRYVYYSKGIKKFKKFERNKITDVLRKMAVSGS